MERTRKKMKLKTTTEQIAINIKRAIFKGKFLPGEKLKESDITEWLEVSRTPIREAFRLLEAERIVKIIPNRGIFVNLITAEELDNFFELRSLLDWLLFVFCRLQKYHHWFAYNFTLKYRLKIGKLDI